MPPDPAKHLTLASGSAIRADLLRRAGVTLAVAIPKLDEAAIRDSLLAEDATPHDIADTLAEMKAVRIAANTRGLVLGCDQVLAIGDRVIGKPSDPQDARAQLAQLSGQTHRLLSAAVLLDDQTPVWRHVGVARLTMHGLSTAFISAYVDRNWDSIRHSVGCYKIEEEGPRLFSAIEGSHFTIQGLPLLEILAFLRQRGTLAT